MSVAATSIQAWFEINREGVTQRQQRKIYRQLYTSLKPQTANEISEVLNMRVGSVAGRLNAMADDGHAARCGKRPCKNSGRMAETWESK